MLSSIDQFNVMSYTYYINSMLPGTHPKLQHCPQYKNQYNLQIFPTERTFVDLNTKTISVFVA